MHVCDRIIMLSLVRFYLSLHSEQDYHNQSCPNTNIILKTCLKKFCLYNIHSFLCLKISHPPSHVPPKSTFIQICCISISSFICNQFLQFSKIQSIWIFFNVTYQAINQNLFSTRFYLQFINQKISYTKRPFQVQRYQKVPKDLIKARNNLKK